ncbi:hypothetical protein TNCV_4636231 [Trichonephila clavipes]|uniref:Uncharacterized protein n=1 Tax=Trichonephila clavipes TaxID=2585209 RepID=A0A8X6RA45_TRICX|nr:hypothetical protein TNCV_4636231 [Trichonephila clavipes]
MLQISNESIDADVYTLKPEVKENIHHDYRRTPEDRDNILLDEVAQQPMRDRAYCAHPSIRDHWALSFERGRERRMGLTSGSRCASRLWRFFLADEKGVKGPENCRGPAFKADQITSKRIRYGFITVQSTTLIGAQEHNLAGHKVR